MTHKNDGDGGWALERGVNKAEKWLEINNPSGLRDQFAMAALQGLLSCVGEKSIIDALAFIKETIGTTSHKFLSESAYRYADAMLKEREK